ncbi:MAG: hypothetical protein ACI9VR_000759 [Cognaticolwellia sp.]|jgi:hypothetical protein
MTLTLLSLLFAQEVHVRPYTGPGAPPLNAQLLPYIIKYSGQVKYCYETGLKSNATLSGRVEIAMVLSQGRVTSATVQKNSTGDEALGTCIAVKVARWPFPSELSGETVYPFVFEPAEPAEPAEVEEVQDPAQEEEAAVEPSTADEPAGPMK